MASIIFTFDFKPIIKFCQNRRIFECFESATTKEQRENTRATYFWVIATTSTTTFLIKLHISVQRWYFKKFRDGENACRHLKAISNELLPLRTVIDREARFNSHFTLWRY